MKRNNIFDFFTFAIVVLTLSACTVAEEYDVFHRDGKTYITSLRVHTGVPDAEELGSRTFFDTRDDYYGIVYWEDGKTPFWPEDGEGTFGPDHLYFFNSNRTRYAYADCISDYFCAKQYNDGHYYKPNDPSKHQWATFNLQLRTPALQKYKDVGDPTYYGYYCPAIEEKKPSESQTYDMELHDQNGQGNVVLRSYLRSSDVLWLEHPHPAEGPEGVVSNKHRLRWTEENNQDIYFSHIFSLVEVDIKRNDDACTVWVHGQGGNEGEEEWSSKRRVGKSSQNGMDTGDDSHHFNKLSESVQYEGNLSYLPMCNVDLIGNSSVAFLKEYSFDDSGQWYVASKHSTVRCTRTDSDKNDLSLLYPDNEGNIVKYYFLVYSFEPISTLTVSIVTPRYEADGTISHNSTFERRIEFPLENGFKFEPGKYYKLALDLGLPDEVSTANVTEDKEKKPIYDENGKRRFLDRDWITSSYHLLAPSAEMQNIRWGIKFNEDGTIDYKEQNELVNTTNN